jgi:hypothetical protein
MQTLCQIGLHPSHSLVCGSDQQTAIGTMFDLCVFLTVGYFRPVRRDVLALTLEHSRVQPYQWHIDLPGLHTRSGRRVRRSCCRTNSGTTARAGGWAPRTALPGISRQRPKGASPSREPRTQGCRGEEHSARVQFAFAHPARTCALRCSKLDTSSLTR